MDDTRVKAASGLKLVFIGQIILIVSAALACLSSISPVVTLLFVITDGAALLVSAVGLVMAMKAHDGYRTALFFTLVVLVMDVLAALTAGWVYILLRAVAPIVAYMGIAYVCDATAALCPRDRDLKELEGKVRSLYLGCSAIGLLCYALLLVSAISDMGGFMMLASHVVQIIGVCYFMYFLSRGRKALGK